MTILTSSPNINTVEPTAPATSHCPDVRLVVVKKPRRASNPTDRTSRKDPAAGGTNPEVVSSGSPVNTVPPPLRTLSRLNPWKDTNGTDALGGAVVGSPSWGSG